MIKVYSPNKSFNGVVANVTFIDGVGETNSPYSLDYFERKGYTLKDNESKKEIETNKPVEAQVDSEGNFDDMNIAELRAIAKEKGIKSYHNMGKNKLISKLKES